MVHKSWTGGLRVPAIRFGLPAILIQEFTRFVANCKKKKSFIVK